MTEKRTGARRMSEIPPETLFQLNRGELATANLVEMLAIDQAMLVEHAFTQWGAAADGQAAAAAIRSQKKKPSAMEQLRLIAAALAPRVKYARSASSRFGKLARHPSDVVRSWAALLIPHAIDDDPPALLDAIRPFAADEHFGVREIAWMAVRDPLARCLPLSIQLLAEWSTEADGNIRRFASEVLRPAGVWCKHIPELKQKPAQFLPVLEPLKSDPSKYVRDSVANWLNDAAKAQPKWVAQVCRRWKKESPTPHTEYIIRRGQRSLTAE